MKSTTSIRLLPILLLLRALHLPNWIPSCFFDEGVTAKGKPLVYHLMNEDLKKAYELAKEESAQNAEITPVFLQKLNAALMRTTGSVYNVMGGSFDSSKGEFRLCGVTAGGGRVFLYELS